MKIIAYLNPASRSSMDVRTILKKYKLKYEEHDIVKSPNTHTQIIRNPGQQPSSPCVEIDGTMLVNVSGETVEKYLLKKGLVESIYSEPRKAHCIDEEREAIRSKTVRFF